MDTFASRNLRLATRRVFCITGGVFPVSAVTALVSVFAIGRRRLVVLLALAGVLALAWFMPEEKFETGSIRVLGAVGVVFLLFMFDGASKGYSRGPVRQLATLLALAAAAGGAWLWGAPFGHWALKLAGVPLLLRAVGGTLILFSVLWLFLLAVLWSFGKPQTNDLGETDSPVLGAVVGCWTGILWGAAAALAFAAAGAFAQYWLDISPNAGAFKRGALRRLVLVKNSLALYPHAGGLRTWNPLPARTRRTFEKAIRLFNTPGGAMRLQRAEAVRAFLTEPAIYPLTQDPEIYRLIITRDIEGLLAHPRIRQLLADDIAQRRILELLDRADIEAMLDEALPAAAKSPAPAPILQSKDTP
jgi:uncharacterized membrane protein required for colicin V production